MTLAVSEGATEYVSKFLTAPGRRVTSYQGAISRWTAASRCEAKDDRLGGRADRQEHHNKSRRANCSSRHGQNGVAMDSITGTDATGAATRGRQVPTSSCAGGEWPRGLAPLYTSKPLS